jgi:Protein of unknown function (DUF2946)
MPRLRNRRWLAWIAICAILLNAFAPSLAHALAARHQVSWLEVCTSTGLARTALDPRAARTEIPSGAHFVATDHCPYCAPHGASFAHAPPTVVLPAAINGPAVLSPQRFAAPATAAPTARFLARAPPSFS